MGARRSAARAGAAAGAQVHLESGDPWRLTGSRDRERASRRPAERRPRFLHRGGHRQARRLRRCMRSASTTASGTSQELEAARDGRARRLASTAPSRARPRPDAHRRLGADVGPTIDVPKDQPIDRDGHPVHLRSGAQHDLPVARAWAGPKCSARPTSSSASTRSTTPAIPTAGPSSSARSKRLARLATRAGVEGRPLTVHTPLIELSKADIVRLGLSLGLDYGLTHSCYDPRPDGRPCGHCDSCRLRAAGFAEAGATDPLIRRTPSTRAA